MWAMEALPRPNMNVLLMEHLLIEYRMTWTDALYLMRIDGYRFQFILGVHYV